MDGHGVQRECPSGEGRNLGVVRLARPVTRVAAIAIDVVISGSCDDNIRACAAFDEIRVAGADEGVVTIATRQHVPQEHLSDTRLRERDLGIVGRGLGEDDVVAAPAQQEVAVRSTLDPVVALAAEPEVLMGAKHQRVIPVKLLDNQVVGVPSDVCGISRPADKRVRHAWVRRATDGVAEFI